MLQVQNLTFGYHRKAALLQDFSMDLKPGHVTGLLGRNGAGKTTLIYLMAGLLTPDHGQVALDGVNVRDRKPITLCDIYLVPEEFEFPAISINRYVEVNAPFYPNFNREAMAQYLAIFELDGDLHLNALSMGQKKKAHLSFALAAGTRVLLLDEPTNGLDIPGKIQFRKAIAQSITDERSILISTHQVRDVDAIIDHVTIIEHSKLLLDRGVDEIERHLAFVDGYDPSLALAVVPTPGGSRMVTVNTDGRATQIDMELLFAATLEHPDMVAQAFAS